MDFLKNVFENRIGAGNSGSGGEGSFLDRTVTFTVDGNEYAKFSVVNGAKIPEPVTPAVGSERIFKYWQDGESIVSFPYTPQTDKVMVAKITEDLVTELYEFYSVDRSVYPYVLMVLDGSYSYIYFCWYLDLTQYDDRIFLHRDNLFNYKNAEYVGDPSNIGDVVQHIKTNLPTLTINNYTSGVGSNARQIVYANVLPTTLAGIPATVYQI